MNLNLLEQALHVLIKTVLIRLGSESIYLDVSSFIFIGAIGRDLFSHRWTLFSGILFIMSPYS